MSLAIDGGKPAVSSPLHKFNTIGAEEVRAAAAAMYAGPLSGYLGGELHGGLRVEALEDEFAGELGARHAVAVNSATSGLLMACAAAGVGRESTVVTTPYTMSATAAAPAFLGANLIFGDIEDQTFSLQTIPEMFPKNMKALIVTNLFGHPAPLEAMKGVCEVDFKCALIEDNAQSPFAMEGKRYAGTVGDIGVFSFNVHKHLQSGEGGIAVTDNDELADRMRLFRNHGELAGLPSGLGLNLRMTEVTAAIALAQLAKREQIISSRIELAEDLTDMVKDIPGLRPPVVREGCRHVYYVHAMLLDHDRDWFVKAMQAEGVPLKAGYVKPLYKLPAFKQDTYCPITEAVEKRIVLFEVCGHDPSAVQRKQMREAFSKVGEAYAKKQVQSEAASLEDVDAARA